MRKLLSLIILTVSMLTFTVQTTHASTTDKSKDETLIQILKDEDNYVVYRSGDKYYIEVSTGIIGKERKYIDYTLSKEKKKEINKYLDKNDTDYVKLTDKGKIKPKKLEIDDYVFLSIIGVLMALVGLMIIS